MTAVDEPTRRWIRNAADERAAADGCRFNEARGEIVLRFAEQCLTLYEGEAAGKPLVPMPWQVDVTMRLFGWERYSERWGRWVRRFTQASIWCPKKQGKSPTLAWWGLYLLCADGEQGQKVFSAAKDATQAAIAHRHAFEMARSSPSLAKHCTFRVNTMQIAFLPARGTYTMLSSGAQRNQMAKEGINGSILVDETHVVDRDFMARIKRAGISRSEPLLIEVSTAGRDPDCYGKERYEYGKQVESGRRHDPTLLYVAYEAPQDVTDQQLADDPVKYGRMANPAWGHTISEEEYLADYRTSQASISDAADFKTYRLNIWQRSANPWLRATDWAACYDPRHLDTFAGQPCWLGLDLSKTRDMSALVLVFRGAEDGHFHQYPICWLPEATARSSNHLAPFLQWAGDGFLRLIPGEVVEQEYIYEALQDVAERFRPQGLWYDRTFAHDLALKAERELGIPRCEFPQTTMVFAGPVADYERLVIQHTLHHDGHDLLRWQAGHCNVHTDSKGRKTLVKPKHGDHKKIDGMVAGVMALFGAIADANRVVLNYYETHELEVG